MKPQFASIKIKQSTKASLDKWKVHPRESYDDVIQRLMKLALRYEVFAEDQ